MPNDAKVGLLLGVLLVVAAALFFRSRPPETEYPEPTVTTKTPPPAVRLPVPEAKR